MSETLVSTLDAYRPVFEAIETTPDITTADAYRLYMEFVEQNGFDPCIYLSMAITSGGYARDKELPFPEALAKNNAHGDLMADIVAQQYQEIGIAKSDIVLPSTLGKVPGWGQADYLLFWAHVITGLEPDQAAQIDRNVRAAGVINAPGFVDKTLSREERWQDYKRLADTYVDQLDELPRPLWPKNMQAIILILDAQESLGVNAERYLAHKLGLGEYVFNVEPALGVSEQLEVVRSLGATTLEVSGMTNVISGRHQLDTHLQRRTGGQHFRKSGLISGIVDRRDAERQASRRAAQPPVPQKTQKELWEEYYAS